MINEISALPETQTFSNVTFYVKQDMAIGLTRVDARTLTVEVRPYAQYDKAIHLTWLAKGQRRERGYVVSGYRPFFVLVNTAAAVTTETFGTAENSTPGVTVRRSLYGSCDPRWGTDLIAKLDQAGITPIIQIAPKD